MIDIELWGTEPAPQGSKNPWGGEANPRTKPWRAAVASEAAAVMQRLDLEPLDAPVHMNVVFVFARPKGHFGTGRNAGSLKANAPTHKTGKPDLDKLVRAIGDALTGVVVRDDSRFVSLRVSKVYTDEHHRFPGVTIHVRPLDSEA